MANIQITKAIVQDFANSQSNESIHIVFEHLQTAAREILQEMSKKNTFINPDKCLFFVRDDYFFGTQTPKSEMRFVLAIESAHIEINSSKLILDGKSLFKKELKNFFLNARKKNKRKMRKQLEKQSKLVLKPETYDILAFQREFFLALADYFTPITTIRNLQNQIMVLSKEELGINIGISVAIKSGNIFRFWSDDANAFIDRNYYLENQLIEKKQKETKNQFYKLTKVFSSLFDALEIGQEGHYLACCLLYNVPNEWYTSSTYDSFIKICNYLFHANFKQMMGIIYPNKLLFGSSEEVKITLLEAKRIVKTICNSLHS